MKSDALKAAGLLLLSNTFMTTAWYGHLRFREVPMWLAIVGSWGIAFFEYVLQVPANRIGHRTLSAYQLKIIQEAITLVVFVVFSRLVLGEELTVRRGIAFLLVFAAVAVGMGLPRPVAATSGRGWQQPRIASSPASARPRDGRSPRAMRQPPTPSRLPAFL